MKYWCSRLIVFDYDLRRKHRDRKRSPCRFLFSVSSGFNRGLSFNFPAGGEPSSMWSFLAILSPLLAHAILDIVIDDKVQLFVRETVMLSQDAVYFINDGFT